MESRYLAAAVLSFLLIGGLTFTYVLLTRKMRAERRAYRRAEKRRLAERQARTSRAAT